MTCYEIILTGRIPVEDVATTDYDLVIDGERPKLPTNVEPWMRDLITECWHSDPLERPDFKSIVDILTIVENEAHFVLECSLYNPIRDKFPSLFENVLLGSFKSFFQFDQQVNICFYLTEATALRHSRESTGLKPSLCTFNPISLFNFPDSRINFTSLHLGKKKSLKVFRNLVWISSPV